MTRWMADPPLWAAIVLIVIVWALVATVLHQAGIVDVWYWRPD